MGRDPVRNSAVAVLILGAIVAFALFLALRPLYVETPASRVAQKLLRLDNLLGATVEPVDHGTAGMLGLSSGAGELVVTSVANNGPAAGAGIRVGDVIERIGGLPAAKAEAPALSAAATPVLINRRGKHAKVSVGVAGGSSG